jgi:hypothetical protein
MVTKKLLIQNFWKDFNSGKKENDEYTQKTESNEPRTIFTKAGILNLIP